MPARNPIIMHSHLGWDWVWQRPQQFASRLAQRHRLLFVDALQVLEGIEEPRFDIAPAPSTPGVTLLQMQFPASRFGDGAWVDAQRTRLLREALSGPLREQFDSPLQWFYDPMAAPCFVGQVGERANIYDCMDELSGFRFAQPELIERERGLLCQADLVITGGRHLCRAKSRFNANCHFHGCGADVEHFAHLHRGAAPPELEGITAPILGYFGVVDERLDYDLIARLADANAGWHLVFVGPRAKVEESELPRRDNIHWLGKRDYAELPAYASRFDVCLMPFALSPATAFINPTKALEYMAAARPIVSTAVPDVVSNFGSVVHVARSHGAFVQACRRALLSGEAVEDRVERGLEMARANTWEAVVARIEALLDQLPPIGSKRDAASNPTCSARTPAAST